MSENTRPPASLFLATCNTSQVVHLFRSPLTTYKHAQALACYSSFCVEEQETILTIPVPVHSSPIALASPSLIIYFRSLSWLNCLLLLLSVARSLFCTTDGLLFFSPLKQISLLLTLFRTLSFPVVCNLDCSLTTLHARTPFTQALASILAHTPPLRLLLVCSLDTLLTTYNPPNKKLSGRSSPVSGRSSPERAAMVSVRAGEPLEEPPPKPPGAPDKANPPFATRPYATHSKPPHTASPSRSPNVHTLLARVLALEYLEEIRSSQQAHRLAELERRRHRHTLDEIASPWLLRLLSSACALSAHHSCCGPRPGWPTQVPFLMTK